MTIAVLPKKHEDILARREAARREFVEFDAESRALVDALYR